MAGTHPFQRLAIQMKDMNIDVSHWQDVDDDTLFVAALSTSGLIHPSGLGTVTLDAGSLSEEDLQVAIRGSRGMHNADSWVRGDLMVYVRDTHYNGGDIPREELIKWATQFGTSWKRLLNNMTTSAAWDMEYRYPSSLLSNTHHEILNALPLDERVVWAERAISEGMSSGTLRRILREDGLSIKPVYDEVGEKVGEEAEFLSETFDETYAIDVIASWVQKEMAKGVSVKVACQNVLLTFRKASLIRFPARTWQNAMTNSGMVASNGEDEDDE